MGSCKTASSYQGVLGGTGLPLGGNQNQSLPSLPIGYQEDQTQFAAAVRYGRPPSSLLSVAAFVSCLDRPGFILSRCNVVQTGYCVWGDRMLSFAYDPPLDEAL